MAARPARKSDGAHAKPPSEEHAPLSPKTLRAVAGREATNPGIDPLVHDKMRLAALSALAAEPQLSYVELKDLLGASDGNLSVHARKLEEGGLIRAKKSGSGPGSRTEFSITARGRRALEGYLRHMEELIAAVRRPR